VSVGATALAVVAAVLLDAALGEPRRAHPLIAFGRLANAIETRLHGHRRSNGALAWALAVLPPVLACVALLYALKPWPWLHASASALVLYACLGLRSLGEHARPVARSLAAGDLDAARSEVGRMVSRDTQALSEAQIAAAATESVLENGNDAVFGALFWFALLGAPGALLYRLANTLDAMWGYRTPCYARFGWAAARIDDGLNYVPARLTALSYALLGKASVALRCWRAQAPLWDSPNAGPVMAAGAGALGVRLGGAAPYHGRWEPRPELGEGDAPDAGSILRALRLVRKCVVLWLLAICAIALAIGMAGVGDTSQSSTPSAVAEIDHA
jgi:adenosylcobinamide-phosphate synthase